MNRILYHTYYKQASVCRLFLLLGNTVCTFFTAQFLADFLDNVSRGEFNRAGQCVAWAGLLIAAQLVLEYVQKRWWTGQKLQCTNRLECEVYRRYLNGFARLKNESELTVVFEKDIPQVEGYYTDTLPRTIQAVIGVVLYGAFLAQEKGGVALLGIMAVLGLFQFLPPVITEKYLIKNYIKAGQEEAQVRQQILAGLEGIHTIKMRNLEGWFMEQFLGKQKAFQKTGERAAATSSVQSALHSGVSLLQQLGLLLIGLGGVTWGWFSLATLVQGYILSASFYGYTSSLGAFRAARGVYKAAVKRIGKLFEVIQGTPNGLYTALELTLPQAGVYLLKGENGAGKSTLLSVISGYIDCGEKIYREGQDGAMLLGREERQQKVSWCPQMYLNLSESFDKLCSMMAQELLDREVLAAVLGAFAVPDALYHKPMNQLSGGEQKRFMIALAVARKGDIILLDEPEVSLDHDSLTALVALLEKEKRLVLLVTHNDSFETIAAGSLRIKEGSVYVEA